MHLVRALRVASVWLAAVVLVATLLMTLGYEVLDPASGLYLTNWSVVNYAVYGVFNAIAETARPNAPVGQARAVWRTATLALSLLVTAGYWAVSYPQGPEVRVALSVLKHGANAVVTLADCAGLLLPRWKWEKVRVGQPSVSATVLAACVILGAYAAANFGYVLGGNLVFVYAPTLEAVAGAPVPHGWGVAIFCLVIVPCAYAATLLLLVGIERAVGAVHHVRDARALRKTR